MSIHNQNWNNIYNNLIYRELRGGGRLSVPLLTWVTLSLSLSLAEILQIRRKTLSNLSLSHISSPVPSTKKSQYFRQSCSHEQEIKVIKCILSSLMQLFWALVSYIICHHSEEYCKIQPAMFWNALIQLATLPPDHLKWLI